VLSEGTKDVTNHLFFLLPLYNQQAEVILLELFGNKIVNSHFATDLTGNILSRQVISNLMRDIGSSKFMLEIRRKFLHVFLGIILFYMLIFFPKGIVLSFIVVVMIASLISAYLYTRYNIPFLTWISTKLDRPSTFPFRGGITFLIGCFIAVLLFSSFYAALSILILSVGDGIAAIAGHYLGKHKIVKSKTLEGTTAFFITTLIVLAFFLPGFKAFFVALILALVELTTPQYIDDNISLPLVSGVLLTVL
jgi:dolichol kinase